MACPGAVRRSFDSASLAAVRYEETAHLRVYREFLADPERFLDGGGQAVDQGGERS